MFVIYFYVMRTFYFLELEVSYKKEAHKKWH